MKKFKIGTMTIMVVAAVSVTNAGFFDAVKKVANDAANVAENISQTGGDVPQKNQILVPQQPNVAGKTTSSDGNINNKPTSEAVSTMGEVEKAKGSITKSPKRVRQHDEGRQFETKKQVRESKISPKSESNSMQENDSIQKNANTVRPGYELGTNLSAWENKLKELGYSSEEIPVVMRDVKQLVAHGSLKDKEIMAILSIHDKREEAKDVAAEQNIDLNDPKALSPNDKIIITHIDQMLVPRLELREAISKQEIDKLKIKILVQTRKLPTDQQVQVADNLIKEMIRMHNL